MRNVAREAPDRGGILPAHSRLIDEPAAKAAAAAPNRRRLADTEYE
jgi:hypothetical protein